MQDFFKSTSRHKANLCDCSSVNITHGLVFAEPGGRIARVFWLLFDFESCSNFCSKRINGLSLDMNVATYSLCWLWYSKGSVWPIEWRFELTCAVYWAGLAIIYTVSLVVFGLTEKFEFHLFLQNVRAQMTDILWRTVDIFHYLTLHRM